MLGSIGVLPLYRIVFGTIYVIIEMVICIKRNFIVLMVTEMFTSIELNEMTLHHVVRSPCDNLRREESEKLNQKSSFSLDHN